MYITDFVNNLKIKTDLKLFRVFKLEQVLLKNAKFVVIKEQTCIFRLSHLQVLHYVKNQHENGEKQLEKS